MYLAHFGAAEFREPKYNHFFSQLQNAVAMFMRPAGKSKWQCAECGRVMRRGAFYWTQLVPFRGACGGFTFELRFGELHEALTPVCSDCVLQMWEGGGE
ncbi:MAG: hypothetical protein JNJ83_11105 [Verrucomicrobiaceae bacterium]|nr:hypothetical protein [Verrucomicrobiaceae bacterium]